MTEQASALLVIVLALTSVGVLMVYSAGGVDVVMPEEPQAGVATNGPAAAEPEAAIGEVRTGRHLKSHLVSVGIGLFGMFCATRFDYHRFARPAVYRFLVLVTIALLMLVLGTGLGHEAGGAQRWLRLPGTTFGFQPSELAKMVLVILLAVKLTANQGEITSFTRGFLPAIGLMVVFASLVLFEDDLGNPVVMGAAAFTMIFMAGTRWIFVILSVIMGVAGVAAVALTTPYRVQRLIAFSDPWQYAQTNAWQLIQSLAAFARGGVAGQGIGGSEQKLFYLPAAHTDFIFAVWGEEAGLAGTLLVVTLFAVFLLVALRVANCAPDLFGTLLAAGIATLISVQAAFNMGVTTGLLPTKGLTLPFISYGGSALMTNLTMVGILLNIALQANEKEAKARLKPARA